MVYPLLIDGKHLFEAVLWSLPRRACVSAGLLFCG